MISNGGKRVKRERVKQGSTRGESFFKKTGNNTPEIKNDNTTIRNKKKQKQHKETQGNSTRNKKLGTNDINNNTVK